MTLNEIENQLPNGLHDAELLSFSVDLAAGTLLLKVEVYLFPSDPSVPRVEYPCTVTIMVSGLCYFKLGPPDPAPISGTSWISAGDDGIAKGLIEPGVATKLPAGAFLHYIFLGDWNASMIIGAMDARIEYPAAS